MKKILIITYAKVGDSFILVPALNFLKEFNKDVKIDIFSEKRENSIYNIEYALKDTNLINKFYLFNIDDNKIIRIVKKFFLLQYLKRQHYDVIYILLPPYRPATPKLFINFYKMIEKIKPTYFYIPNFIEWKKKNNSYLNMVQSIKYIFDFVSNSVQENVNIDKYIFYNKTVDKTALPQKKYVIVVLQTDMKVKNYNLDDLKYILSYIQDTYNFNFAFVGSEKERELINEFSNYFANSKTVINYSFNDLYSFFINYGKFYLGLDTGILHLANLSKLPIFAIFSARDVPGSWYPYGVKYKIIRDTIECEGCLNVNQCNFNIKCMDIDKHLVIKQLEKFIKELK